MLERRLLEGRLKEGFAGPDGTVDVDGFISFSLSVHNRRKSRAGLALEHGLAEIFRQNRILFDWHAKTEDRKTPDFLFPSAEEYRDAEFPDFLLSMLSSKTTSKDRWRQALNEADRIAEKHTVTLEPAISETQTDEMKNAGMRLVVPAPIQPTYTVKQQSWLLSLADFITLVKERQTQGAKHSARVQAFLKDEG